MSKFNNSIPKTQLTTNNEGAKAYPMMLKDLLVTQVLTTLFNEQKFYGDNSKKIVETIREVLDYDAKFVANLTLYTRKEMHLRSISHVLMSELSNHPKGKIYARQVIKDATIRVDDMTETLSYYMNSFGKPIANSMKKGLADSFKKFNEYSLAKYNKLNKDIKLKDILCLTHPKPSTQEQSILFKKVLENTLEIPVTWETQLSKHGNKKEVWENLIDNNKLGYMAMIRNLRNILNANVSNIDKVYNFLSNEVNVLKNKQLPFRYYSAYKTLEKENKCSSKVLDVLEKAIKVSTKNINTLKGKTLIAVDVSASMKFSSISRHTDITPADIGSLLASIGNYICEDVILYAFDTNLYNVTMPSSNGIISNAKSIRQAGGGTDLTLPIRRLLDENIFVDRIIVLSDNEIQNNYSNNENWFGRHRTSCQEYVNQYRKSVNKNVWVHAIDLQGYGTQQFKDNKTNIIAGWSEKVFDFIDMAENGIGNLIKTIDSYQYK